MLWLIFGILTLLFGIWALSKGRLIINNKYALEGKQARIAGIVLVIAPIIGAIFSLNEQGDWIYVFGSSCYGIIGVLAFAAFQGWKSKKSPQKNTQLDILKSEPEVSRNRNSAQLVITQSQPVSSSDDHQQETTVSSINRQPDQKELPSKGQLDRKPHAITTCPKCGYGGFPGDRFCRKCGNPMKSEIHCKKCGNIIQPKDYFCVRCGNSLLPKTTEDNESHSG